MKIAVLLSGGVDSSVALRLLQKQGHDVTAFYIKIWLEDELKYLGDCPWEKDLKYARAVCAQAGVPLKVISLQKEYWREIVSYTIQELAAGRTPNPDMLCNQRIKFGQFIKKAPATRGGFDAFASGHYAQIIEKSRRFLLKRSPDPIKDQTYFLAYLNQTQLRRIIFPIGKFTKTQVRHLAQEYNLPNKNRKDSQGICFLGSIKYSNFIKHHLGEKRGDLVDVRTGAKIGEHNGFWYYTIGQRSAIRLSGGPWYVVKKDVKKNRIYVGRKKDLPNESTRFFVIKKINWIEGRPSKKRALRVRMRHGGVLYSARITLKRNRTVAVKLAKPLHNIAPGQFAVFYDGKYCLGGGVII